MNISIRKATAEDLSAIYDLVVELAVYEKEPEAVTATLETYQKNFKEGWFESIVATENEEVVGMMIYYNTFSTWKGKMLYLEDFVVSNEHRRKGIGQLLFDELFNIGREKGVKLVKWQVLDWNEPAINFYKKNQSIMEEEWNNCKVFL